MRRVRRNLCRAETETKESNRGMSRCYWCDADGGVRTVRVRTQEVNEQLDTQSEGQSPSRVPELPSMDRRGPGEPRKGKRGECDIENMWWEQRYSEYIGLCHEEEVSD